MPPICFTRFPRFGPSNRAFNKIRLIPLSLPYTLSKAIYSLFKNSLSTQILFYVEVMKQVEEYSSLNSINQNKFDANIFMDVLSLAEWLCFKRLHHLESLDGS